MMIDDGVLINVRLEVFTGNANILTRSE